MNTAQSRLTCSAHGHHQPGSGLGVLIIERFRRCCCCLFWDHPWKDNTHFKLGVCVCVCVSNLLLDEAVQWAASLCLSKPPPLPPLVYFRSWLVLVFSSFFFSLKKKSRCNLSDPLFVSLSVVLEGDRDVCVCVSERERVNVCVLSKTKVEHWKKNECKRFEALIFELSVWTSKYVWAGVYVCSWDHGGWGWEERKVWQCEGKPSTLLSCVLKLALRDEGSVSWKQKETKVTEEGKKEVRKKQKKERTE